MFLPVNIRCLAISYVFDDDLDDIELNIGDLHANPMLLIYILHRYGVIRLTQKYYDEMFDVYFQLALNPWLEKEQIMPDVNRFLELLQGIHFNKTPIKFRLIGDELSDRGACDLFIIELLRLMQKNQVQYTILLSNHGICFLEAFHALKAVGQAEQKFRMIDESAMRSFWNFKTLYDWGEVDLDAINLLLQEVYFPHINLVDMAFDEFEDTINLYTHAAIGLNDLQQIAKEYECQWNDDSLFQMGQSIKGLQKVFKTQKLDELLNLFTRTASIHLKGEINPELFSLTESRLWKFCWNREYDEAVIYRPHHFKSYRINYFYGHDSSNEPDEPKHCKGLDGLLGKPVVHSRKGQMILTEERLKVYQQEVIDFEHRFEESLKPQPVAIPYQLPWNNILPCIGVFALGVYLKNKGSATLPVSTIFSVVQQLMGNLFSATPSLTQDMIKRR